MSLCIQRKDQPLCITRRVALTVEVIREIKMQATKPSPYLHKPGIAPAAIKNEHFNSTLE